MPSAKPLPVAVAALLAVIRRNGLLDHDSLSRLRVRLVRAEISDLPGLRRWLSTGDVNPKVGRALAKLLPAHDQLYIGECHVLAHLTDGGMGSVDLVEHAGQLRVCKTIKAGQRGENVAKRFRREAAITATFDHPHLVRCFGHGEDQDRLYLVLEWVPGGDAQLLVDAAGSLPAGEALTILHQAALGLAHAHGRNLVHRDIKPANLFVTEAGTIRVADFGLARSTSEDASWMTAAGATVGTPSYMAPEQIRGDEMDGRADLYALGCVLHFCLTGHPPWSGTIADVLHGHLDLEPPHPTQRGNDLPPALLALHRELLAKKPAQRPASAAIVAERSAMLLTALNRDPGDGLGQRSVDNSTARLSHSVVATQPESLDAVEAVDVQPRDPTTKRVERHDERTPTGLEVALCSERIQLAVAPPGDGHRVATLLAGDQVSLGREADLVAGTHQDLGRIHCRLVRYDDAPAILDESSTNGTWLDDRWLPPGRAEPLVRDQHHRLRLGSATSLTLRAIAQRSPPVVGLDGRGLGSAAGWDAVVVQPLAAAWVLRRLTIGPAGTDLPLTPWNGGAVEVARWNGAWVWRQGDRHWQGLAPGPLGQSGLLAGAG